ncbi:MAG: formylglycine-generating enzyme family protein [Kangiellaceae bacterium]|nr:formylglycine-generating enzyme family protein [Kangiellaceae bacterium]
MEEFNDISGTSSFSVIKFLGYSILIAMLSSGGYWTYQYYIEKKTARSKDLIAFNRAFRLNTVDSYKTYLKGNLNGRFIRQARRLLKELTVEAESTAKLNQLTGPMLPILGGQFDMGSNVSPQEQPVHKELIKPFYIGQYEVTHALWSVCVEDGACQQVDDQGWGREQHPVINVSYHDVVNRFIPWINQKTGKIFRLPTEAEWEYAARAGSKFVFSWGDSISCQQAAYGMYQSTEGQQESDCNAQWHTENVGSYKPNAYGLYDVHGNVAEWTLDCWHPNYKKSQKNGNAWLKNDCTKHVIRGGSMLSPTKHLRLAKRMAVDIDQALPTVGFRLVREL